MRESAILALLFLVAACSDPSGGTSPVAANYGGNNSQTSIPAHAGDTSAAGSGAAGNGGAGNGAAGTATDGDCESARAALEQTMTAALDVAAVDANITAVPDFTLALETAGGHRFLYSHGASSIDTVYESASTSKWIAAAVILDLVDRGVLSLADEPSLYLEFWKAQGVTLAHLLSFTSGFSKEAVCFNLPNANFAQCVETVYDANLEIAPAPGTAFDYSSTHLQIAGLMAVVASQSAGWSDVFAAWQAHTGLFPNGAFDLPSLQNPRLAGGMHWNGTEYMRFLRAIYSGELLSDATRHAMLDNQRGSARVVGSPTIDALNQDWAYGFGNWLECPVAIGSDTFNCGSGHRNSSPGAYGAYPFIDFDHRYFGLIARQGKLGTFREGDNLFQVVAADAALWADACNGSDT